MLREACQPSWGGLRILQPPRLLCIQKKLVGKNQLRCPAELIVPRQSIIISLTSYFPPISSLSSLKLFPLLFFPSFTPLFSPPPPWILCFFSMSPHWNKRNQDLTNSCERKWLKRKKDRLFLGETGIRFLGGIEKKRSSHPPLCRIAGQGCVTAYRYSGSNTWA